MLKSLLQSFVTAVIERLAATTVGGVAAQAAVESALQEADCLDRIEDAARAYEAAGKPQLASRLRERATTVTAELPSAQQALESPKPTTLLTDAQVEQCDKCPTTPSKRRRRRSAATGGADQ